eukprot:scpid58836/ scgid35275/ 
MSLSTSASNKLRAEGNTYYASGKAVGLAPCVALSRFEKALQLYRKAAEAACCEEERSSAFKNSALASWRAALLDIGPIGHQDPREIYHWSNALENFHKAKLSGHVCDRQGRVEWVDTLLKSLQECFFNLRSACFELDYDNRVEFILKIQQHSLPQDACIWGPLQGMLCGIKYNESVLKREEGCYRDAIINVRSAMQDIAIFVEHRRRHGHYPMVCDLNYEDDELERQARQQERICEAMQACAIGDKVLEKSLMDEETTNFLMVWEAVDHYHTALLLARDQEVEEEAKACSRLAKTFNRVLMLQEKAEFYAKHAMELAESLMPRNLHDEVWFKDASVVLDKIRSVRQRQEEALLDEEMKKYKEELKDELAALEDLVYRGKYPRKGKEATYQEILRYIYEKHPQIRESGYKLPEKFGYDLLKSTFRKALVHYHPDKVDREEDGMKWYTLCTEICKVLSRIYETLK